MTSALCLQGWNTAAIDTFSDDLCVDPSMQDLCEKVNVKTDDKLQETAASVVINSLDGTCVEGFHDLASPLPYEIRQKKIQDKSVTLLDDTVSKRLGFLLSDEVSDMKAVAGAMVCE